MAFKSSDSAFKLRKSYGEQSNEGSGSLQFKMNQLKRQIQAERVVSIKEKVEQNRKNLEVNVTQLLVATRERASSSGQNGVSKMISLRIERPLIKYSGFGYGSGEKDYVSGHEVTATTSIKLPYIERLPPYTTWIFLDRNQRMAEDQSVVGRRRIYYDQHGSEALVCSDSEDDIVEPEEEKHEFSEGEDRFLWTVCQEYGLAEEVLNSVSQFIEVTTSEIEERYNMLKEKYGKDHNVKDHKNSGSERGISLDKSLSAALDSFDNLFCRRCLLFDCRLHGCSQTLIIPSEKQPYWCEYEDDRKPCSSNCFLGLRVNRDLSEGPVDSALASRNVTSEEEKRSAVAMESDEVRDADVGADLLEEGKCVSEMDVTVPPDSVTDSITASRIPNMDSSAAMAYVQEDTRKRKLSESTDMTADAATSIQVPADCSNSISKKQKKVDEDVVGENVEKALILDQGYSAKATTTENEVPTTIKHTIEGSTGHSSKVVVSSVAEEIVRDDSKDVNGVSAQNQSSSTEGREKRVLTISEWTPIEKELYLKGVEMFGKNSCLIARNLLSGLKTCIEVSNYMRGDSGATMAHRSVAPSSNLDDNAKADIEFVDQDMPTRSRLLRRRGRTRKLKYSWKSAGHPSMWKRIADGKNQSCKQYAPCGCQSMCGKECPCLDNGTCCEKYCGCSKSCKNRFRGCHCAKSQCRSRQCPCFAAGRECDPDVCRNCWVSCGDGSLGEPPKRGDGQCGNMRLLLRQQQRILLGKSDVAGWGAFLKNSVNKNEYLGEYTGELISHREADKRGKIYDRANSSFLFDLNDQYVLDAYRKGDKLKFANHSSNPNCYAKVMLVAGDHRVGIFAKDRIEASEELFYDYRYGPDQAPAWARRPEGSKRDDLTVSQGRAKKHQSH